MKHETTAAATTPERNGVKDKQLESPRSPPQSHQRETGGAVRNSGVRQPTADAGSKLNHKQTKCFTGGPQPDRGAGAAADDGVFRRPLPSVTESILGTVMDSKANKASIGYVRPACTRPCTYKFCNYCVVICNQSINYFCSAFLLM